MDLTATAFNDVAMQRIVRISAGETAKPVPLAPYDLSYTMDSGEVCSPCRTIRVDVPASGTLGLRLKWTTGSTPLGLWVNGVQYRPPSGSVLEVAVSVSTSAGQRVVFVEALSSGAHVTFTLESTYSP